MFHSVWRFGHIGVLSRWGNVPSSRAATRGMRCGRDRVGPPARRGLVVALLVGDAAGSLAAQESLDIDVVAASDPACAALLQNSRAMALPLSDGGPLPARQQSGL